MTWAGGEGARLVLADEFNRLGPIVTLADVVAHYAAAPVAPDGHIELRPKSLSDEEKAKLIAFLISLHPAAKD